MGARRVAPELACRQPNQEFLSRCGGESEVGLDRGKLSLLFASSVMDHLEFFHIIRLFLYLTHPVHCLRTLSRIGGRPARAGVDSLFFQPKGQDARLTYHRGQPGP